MNVNLLKGKIISAGITIGRFGEEIGIKRTALYRKLKGESEFSRREMEMIINTLNLTPTDVNDIFFKNKVS